MEEGVGLPECESCEECHRGVVIAEKNCNGVFLTFKKRTFRKIERVQ